MPPEVLQAFLRMVMQQQQQAQPAFDPMYGLPDAVRQSLMSQPSYGEGEIMAPEQWWNPSLGGQMQMSGPQRETFLEFDRGQALGIHNPGVENPWSRAQPEGGMWSSRPPQASPFAPPLDPRLRGSPLGLY